MKRFSKHQAFTPSGCFVAEAVFFDLLCTSDSLKYEAKTAAFDIGTVHYSVRLIVNMQQSTTVTSHFTET